MPILFDLYLTFFRIGILTFGGGLTMLPLLKYELVESKKWISEEKLLDCYAIGQCTPVLINFLEWIVYGVGIALAIRYLQVCFGIHIIKNSI